MLVNDDGGSIFATLEQGAPERAADFERLFGTPHGTDLAALCASVGVPHRRAEDSESLSEALDRPPRGIEVLEVPVDRHGRRALDEALRAAGAAAADAGTRTDTSTSTSTAANRATSADPAADIN